jgi:hypothetical protein
VIFSKFCKLALDTLEFIGFNIAEEKNFYGNSPRRFASSLYLKGTSQKKVKI